MDKKFKEWLCEKSGMFGWGVDEHETIPTEVLMKVSWNINRFPEQYNAMVVIIDYCRVYILGDDDDEKIEFNYKDNVGSEQEQLKKAIEYIYKESLNG